MLDVGTAFFTLRFIEMKIGLSYWIYKTN